MSDLNTIARPEIAELLKVSVTRLNNVILHTDTYVPEPVGKLHNQLLYDREIMLAWIATDPLQHVTWKARPKTLSAAEKNADLTRAFLSGNLGVSKAQRNRILLKKIAAKHAPRSTELVEVDGCDEYTAPCNAWAGLA